MCAPTEEFSVDVAHPVGAPLLLPVTLYIQVVQSVAVQLDHLPHVPLVYLLVRPATLHHHPYLHTEVRG